MLKDKYEGSLEPDEIEADDIANEDEDDFDTYDADNEYIRESAASPPAPNIEGVAKDNFTKDYPNINLRTPAEKSDGLNFGKLFI